MTLRPERNMAAYLKLYAATTAIFLTIDLLWLGVIAKGFYQETMGHLMRADVQWGAALLFYAIYVVAIIVLCVRPDEPSQTVQRAALFGALFGLAAYAAFDLTSLALFKDFPVKGAVVDLIWGTVLTGSVSALSLLTWRWLQRA
jgi:uncharacterized membrane protein